MADHIPLISGEDAGSFAKQVFHDSAITRVSLDRTDRLIRHTPQESKIWIDPGVDGCDDIQARRSKPDKKNPWFDFMSHLPHFEKFAQAGFIAKPMQLEVNAFVTAVLNRCIVHEPAWITIPQLPTTSGSERNKINLSLAQAAGEWKSNSGYSGQMILPLVFTHQEQVNGKTNRNPKVQLAERCYRDAQADGFWVVDQSLIDDNGSAMLRNKRFRGIIDLHYELNGKIASKVRVGGPYWGLNLVLWARGLIDFPLIGVGSGFQFYLSGGPSRSPSVKIAIPSLRRRVGVGSNLAKWLEASIKKLAATHPAHAEFVDLKKNLTLLHEPIRARKQVATFYKQWYDGISVAPKGGRSMALFQDLSAAYALGKSLPPIEGEGTVRRPEAVAESFMMHCL